MSRTWTLEQLTGFLKHAGVNPDGYGERIGETPAEHVKRVLDTTEIQRIVEEDKRVNWPRIQAEMDRRSNVR
jgi:hypothetical protein